MDRERALIWTSRFVAAGAGLAMIFAGWYLLMTAGFGSPPNDGNALSIVVAGLAWTAAGGMSLTAGLIDARNVRPATRLEVLAGILVFAAVPLAAAPLALLPGAVMLGAAAGERLARLRARRTATFTAIIPTRSAAPKTPVSMRRVA